jgi:hypothetical protein
VILEAVHFDRRNCAPSEVAETTRVHPSTAMRCSRHVMALRSVRCDLTAGSLIFAGAATGIVRPSWRAGQRCPVLAGGSRPHGRLSNSRWRRSRDNPRDRHVRKWPICDPACPASSRAFLPSVVVASKPSDPRGACFRGHVLPLIAQSLRQYAPRRHEIVIKERITRCDQEQEFARGARPAG